jgi:hypothetical protein
MKRNWIRSKSKLNDKVFSTDTLTFVSRMLQRKEEELVKRQTIEKRALPKRIRAERKARDMMFRESLRISIHHDPKAEEDKIKKVQKWQLTNFIISNILLISSRSKRKNDTCKNSNVLRRSTW